MGSAGKEDDKLAMNVAAFVPSSPSIAQVHRTAEMYSPLCVECTGMVACTMFSAHARAGVAASPCFSSSLEADLMESNGCGMPASPTLCDSTSSPRIYAVHADMHSPVSPSSTLVYEEGAVAPHGALSTQENNFPNASLPAPFSLQSLSPDAAMFRRAFMCNYLYTLVPALREIHSQSVSSSFDEKLSAVKLAADMSLAVSVGSNNTWSQALLKEVASSSACMSLSHSTKARSRTPARKPSRKHNFSRGSFSMMCKRARSRSSMPALVLAKGNYAGRGTYGTSISSPAADYLSDCSDGFSHSPKWTTLRKKVRQSRLHPFKLKRPLCRSGLASYLRILRSTRCKKKQRSNMVSSLTHDEANRASSPAITKEHIRSLGGLVPGGRSMDVPLLLQEAADYILSLQMQVEALQSLSHFVSP